MFEKENRQQKADERETGNQRDKQIHRQKDRQKDIQKDIQREIQPILQQIDKRQTVRHAGRHADITKRSNKIGKYKKQEKVEPYKNECQMVEIGNKESRKTKYRHRKINIKAKIDN